MGRTELLKEDLKNLTREQIEDILIKYENYIQEAGEMHEKEWQPVCVSEFINNDYQILKNEECDKNV